MVQLNNKIIIEDIITKFGNAISEVDEPYELLTFTLEAARINDVLEYLFHHKQFKFQFLTDLCGVHYPNNIGKELSVVYHVHSLIHNIRIRIKIFFPISDPVVPTVTRLYATANWMERETFDFFGIIFKGHPNLKRILNVDDMDYFQLRKEYPLEDQTRRDKEDFYFGR